jgi:hypothetical protein
MYPQQYTAGQVPVSAQPDQAYGYPSQQPPPAGWHHMPQQDAYPQSAPPAGYWQQPPPRRTWGSGTVVIVCVTVVSVMVGCLALIGSSRQDQAGTAAKVADVPAATTPPSSKPGKPAPLSPPDKAEKVEMPDVKGQNAAVAQDHLGKLGFTNIDFGTQDPAEGFVVLPENWTVKKQSTKPGRTVPTDTLIVLTCTKIG